MTKELDAIAGPVAGDTLEPLQRPDTEIGFCCRFLPSRFCLQMTKELDAVAEPIAGDTLEPLQRLAAELALVAAAATAGTRGYVLGRTHTTCGFGSALGRLALRVVRSKAILVLRSHQRSWSTVAMRRS